MVLHLHPCPPSRHISATPHHQIVSQRFRQLRGNDSEKSNGREGTGKSNLQVEEEEKEEVQEDQEEQEEQEELEELEELEQEEESVKKQETAASRPAAAVAGVSFPFLSVSPKLRGLVALPVSPLPLSFPPQSASGQPGHQDGGILENFYRLFSGPVSLPIREPPLPSAGWEEDKEAKEKDHHKQPRRRSATTARPILSHKPSSTQGQRCHGVTLPSSTSTSTSSATSSSTSAAARESAHAPKPRPSPSMLPFPAQFPPFSQSSPSLLPPRGHPPLQGGSGRWGGRETEGEPGEIRDMPPAVGNFELVDREAQEGMRGGGQPLVMESDLDFLIDFFENEK